MTRPPASTAVIAAASCALLAACSAVPLIPEAAVEKREFTVDFAVPPPERLELQLYRGHVLVGEEQTPQCTVLARVHGATPEEAAARADSIELEAGLEGTVQRVRLGHARGAPLDAVDVRFVVGVPGYMALAVESRAARVSLRQCTSDVDVRTESGDILARPAGGRCNLSTSSGSIELSGAYERAVLVTETGDVEVVVPEKGDGVALEVHSDSGRVVIALPEGCKVKLEHETEKGRLRSDFPVRGDPGEGPITKALLGDPDSERTVHLVVKSRSSLVEVRRQADGSTPPGQ